MIKIRLSNDKIEVSGHAMYDEKGKDIVCSAVSSVVITSVNACLMFDESSIKYDCRDGYIKIEILKHEREVDIVIKNMINMLKSLSNDYAKNIKIYEEVRWC